MHPVTHYSDLSKQISTYTTNTFFIFFILGFLLNLVTVYHAIYFNDFFRLVFLVATPLMFICYQLSKNRRTLFLAKCLLLTVLELAYLFMLYKNGLLQSVTLLWGVILPIIIFSLHRELGLGLLFFNSIRPLVTIQ